MVVWRPSRFASPPLQTRQLVISQAKVVAFILSLGVFIEKLASVLHVQCTLYFLLQHAACLESTMLSLSLRFRFTHVITRLHSTDRQYAVALQYGNVRLGYSIVSISLQPSRLRSTFSQLIIEFEDNGETREKIQEVDCAPAVGTRKSRDATSVLPATSQTDRHLRQCRTKFGCAWGRWLQSCFLFAVPSLIEKKFL